MMRLCCFCEHFHIELVEFIESHEIQVESTSIGCDKNYWYMLGGDGKAEFRHHIKKGLFCKDFRSYTA